MSTGYFLAFPWGKVDFAEGKRRMRGIHHQVRKNGRIISAPTVMAKNPGLKICNTKNKFS